MKLETELPATISEMLNSGAWQMFEACKFGNDFWLEDPDRMQRMQDAAEEGCDGSTHSEHIDDWREHIDALRSEAMRESWNADSEPEGEAMEKEIEAWHDAITAEIDACEKWHADNGSLHEEIG